MGFNNKLVNSAVALKLSLIRKKNRNIDAALRRCLDAMTMEERNHYKRRVE